MSDEQVQEVIIDTTTGEAPVESAQVETEAKAEGVEGGDTTPASSEPADNGEPKSYSLDDLSDDEEEAANQLASMSKEDQDKYMELIEGKAPEIKEKVEDKVEEPAEEIKPLMGIDPDVFRAFSPEKRAEIQNINAKLDEMDAIDVNHFRAGLAKFESDPLIKMRMEQLQGKAQVLDDASVRNAMSPQVIKNLGLDFELHPEKSANILNKHVQDTVHNAISNVVNTYEAGNKQREGKAKLDKELDLVSQSYEGMSSDLPYSDPKHPMKDFMMWLGKNIGGIDVRSIGGKVAYEAYLNATGKSKGLVNNAVARGQQDILDKLKRADKKVATLPRQSNVAKPTSKNEMGIDVKRLHSDIDYVNALLEKFDDNPKMRATIERLVQS